MGMNSLDLTEQEKVYRSNASKTVVALIDLKEGDVLTLEMIALKRSSMPITEQSILEIEHALGMSLRVDVKANSPISKGVI
jgi:sialic acid synthase SpsE